MKGYLIEKYNNMASAYSCKRLVEEAGKVDIDLRMIGALDSFVLPEGIVNGGIVLDKCDVVVNRYKYGKVKNTINALATHSYNKNEINDIYVNKFEQLQRLSSSSFTIPKYMLSGSSVSFNMIVQKLGLPFVAKGLERSMGHEIYLIKTEKEYETLRKDFPDSKEWLLEECITTSLGRDLRLFAIKGEAVACMQRTSTDDFRANVARGASVKAFDISEELRQIARDIYSQSHLDFVGIDLLFGKDSFAFCEVNITPGLEGIEQASGINIAERIMTMIKEEMEQ